jgi:hypothetical protein
MIVDPQQAEAIVADGHADCVALARGFLDDPRWAWHAAAVLGTNCHLPATVSARPPGTLATLAGRGADAPPTGEAKQLSQEPARFGFAPSLNSLPNGYEAQQQASENESYSAGNGVRFQKVELVG